MARLPYADLKDPALQPLVERIVAERGSLLHLYQMLLHSPPIAEGWLALMTAVRQKALAFAGYDHHFVMTDGGHNGQAGGLLLPEAVRWLWGPRPADTPKPAATATSARPAWQPHPDAVPRDDVPHGRIEPMPRLESQVFPGTTREWSLYVPAQIGRAHV